MDRIFVAINIIDADKIINKNGIPIIYDWNGVDNLIDNIKESSEFMNYIYKLIESEELKYETGKLCVFYYKDNAPSQYIEDIQHLYDIDKLHIENRYNEQFYNILNEVYKKAFGKEYDGNPDISYIAQELLDKYKTKMSIKSIGNFLCSNFDTSLSTENINVLYNYIVNTLLKDCHEYKTE